MFPESTVEKIVEFADRHHLTIVSDEVYEEIVYDGKFSSFWGRNDRTIIVNSFSKTFAVTGWRLGFLVASKPLAVELNKIHYHIMACPPTPAQVAILAGFEAGDAATRAMVREFRGRRTLVDRLLKSMPGAPGGPADRCVLRLSEARLGRDRDGFGPRASQARRHHDAGGRVRFVGRRAPAPVVRRLAGEAPAGARDRPRVR